MATGRDAFQDLELIQLVSFGDALSIEELTLQQFRLKTFFAGWVAGEAIRAGRVDLIPCRFSQIPQLMETGPLRIDAAFVQITPPDEAGYASLGVAVDVARQAMEQAKLVVGEINEEAPRTLGDTFVHVREFDLFVRSTEELHYFPRWQPDAVVDRIASGVASLVENGSCVAFSLGSLFEALGPHLARKTGLGIHSPMFTDPLMDLVQSGAVDNRLKGSFRGKCLTSYALGTKELLRWLDRNPVVEFQGIDVVSDPENIARNDRFIAILPGRQVDLTGRIALPYGKGNLATGPAEAYDLVTGAALSRGGRTIVTLPSRNREGHPNVVVSVEGLPNEFSYREMLDYVVTEHGVAYLRGRTVRERAQALIEIAHPDHREALVREAKANHILYPDQIYVAESGKFYPSEIECSQTFKGDLRVRFRAIKPSDEEEMRRLFYRFSDESVYYRYFSPIQTMPHTRMQEYVNVDYRRTMSVVGVLGEAGDGRIIAEARYVEGNDNPLPDVAFVVDEEYQGRGIASFLLSLLCRVAKERGLRGFSAIVLASNKSMMKVFERAPFAIEARVESGVYELTMPFEERAESGKRGLHFAR
jgi:acyl-CoA hydrolase/RimJ/RimL family protein N-acetyltransferase